MKIEILVEVKSGNVAEKTIKSKRDGREYLIREQVGWADLGKEYPQEIRIPLEKSQEAYAAGRYQIDPACLYVDRFQTLSLGRIRLVQRK